MKVIGAGFGRTGTMSLKLALEQLGFAKCYHMVEVFAHPDHVRLWTEAGQGKLPDWDRLFAGYQAAVDWPSCNFWHEQLQRYPQARVILSRRDPDAWYRSVMNTIYPSSVRMRDAGEPQFAPWVEMAWSLIWGGLFDDRMDDAEHVKRVYEQHNAAVVAAAPADQLLVYEPGSGWEPLCEFLGVPVPDTAYPHTNTTEEFQARVSAGDGPGSTDAETR